MFFSCRGAKLALAGTPVQADRTSILFFGGGIKLMFVGVMLIFVGVMNFGQVQKIRFVVVKIFWSNSNQFSVILIWSSELASLLQVVWVIKRL